MQRLSKFGKPTEKKIAFAKGLLAQNSSAMRYSSERRSKKILYKATSSVFKFLGSSLSPFCCQYRLLQFVFKVLRVACIKITLENRMVKHHNCFRLSVFIRLRRDRERQEQLARERLARRKRRGKPEDEEDEDEPDPEKGYNNISY